MLLFSSNCFNRNNSGLVPAFNHIPTVNIILGQKQLHLYNVMQVPWALCTINPRCTDNNVDLMNQLSSTDQPDSTMILGVDWVWWDQVRNTNVQGIARLLNGKFPVGLNSDS